MVDPAELKAHQRFAPAAERNKEPICTALQAVLPATGTVLEIASGTGQHAAYFAPRLAPRHWLPSDPDAEARASICAWRAAFPARTLHNPLNIDARDPNWPQQLQTWTAENQNQVPALGAIASINMIHIAPWAACEGLMAGAEAVLPAGGVLYLYGPFMRAGQHTAPSNEAFDRSLRSQNPAWGVRDLTTVSQLAERHQLLPSDVIEMPANNLSVVFIRQ